MDKRGPEWAKICQRKLDMFLERAVQTSSCICGIRKNSTECEGFPSVGFTAARLGPSPCSFQEMGAHVPLHCSLTKMDGYLIQRLVSRKMTLDAPNLHSPTY